MIFLSLFLQLHMFNFLKIILLLTPALKHKNLKSKCYEKNFT